VQLQSEKEKQAKQFEEAEQAAAKAQAERDAELVAFQQKHQQEARALEARLQGHEDAKKEVAVFGHVLELRTHHLLSSTEELVAKRKSEHEKEIASKVARLNCDYS
jgi:hypothetical protein